MVNNDYYVYVYLNQLNVGEWIFNNHVFNFQPFYVGKGRRNRDIMHLFPSMLKAKSIKNSIIKNIKKEISESPIHLRIYENLSDEEAFRIEKEFIKYFGRLDNGTGILGNHTDGGEGSNNFSLETRKKLGSRKKIYQYNLDGSFIKKWDSISDVGFKNIGNISTAIKRKGSCNGYLWSYTFEESLSPTIKYQMPIKYVNIKQIDPITGNIIKIFDNCTSIEIELKLRKKAKNKIYECINNKIKTAYGYKWEI